ncbi:hypothetical protein AB6A40_002882 [Gnathostoma spinigerum]|uniref:Hepcidin n=1 Tax=Gnathostoma spinigerum TaxID=75299 RepID=A0ABD6E813_9BILA
MNFFICFGFIFVLSIVGIWQCSEAIPLQDETSSALQLKGSSAVAHSRTKRCFFGCCGCCMCCCCCGFFGRRKREALRNLKIKHLEAVLKRFN